MQGNAEHLPLESNSFDAVVNVESAHCYPSFERFADEVERVLRFGGFFLFADLCARPDLDRLRARLEKRFTIVEEELMTLNIVHALEQDSDRRSGMIQRLAPKCFHSALQAFAGVSGTPIFDAFKSGDLQYARFVAQKKP